MDVSCEYIQFLVRLEFQALGLNALRRSGKSLSIGHVVPNPALSQRDRER
jgi:hypothetical protein